MYFRNRNHQAIFNQITNRFARRDKAKMAVLYLLTADIRLWRASKPHVQGQIHLERIRLGTVNEKTYILICCAKELIHGTSFLTIADFADIELISPNLYAIIITAISIYRYGIENKKLKNREDENDKTNA